MISSSCILVSVTSLGSAAFAPLRSRWCAPFSIAKKCTPLWEASAPPSLMAPPDHGSSSPREKIVLLVPRAIWYPPYLSVSVWVLGAMSSP